MTDTTAKMGGAIRKTVSIAFQIIGIPLVVLGMFGGFLMCAANEIEGGGNA